MNQKYSVLMSTYKNDNPEYLKQAIESMLNQTVPPEQYVIVEDGPLPDQLEDVIRSYEEKYGTLFTVVRKPKNEGLASALNTGIKAARNDLLARMDSDDISMSERCEKELQAFDEDPDLDICGCQLVEFINDDPKQKTLYRIVPCTNEEIKKFMRRRQPFNHPSVMYKKSSVVKFHGYRKLMRKEDFDLFSRMITGGCRCRNINEVLYLYRNNEANYVRRKNWQNTSAAFNVYWKHFKRGGCKLNDLILIDGAELFFYLAPTSVMKWVSDKFLRKKAE